MFECAGAHLDHRRPCDLHHSALTVSLDEDLFVIEMAPAWGNREPDRGVVCEGAVGYRFSVGPGSSATPSGSCTRMACRSGRRSPRDLGPGTACRSDLT
jgi:hypothetical protein